MKNYANEYRVKLYHTTSFFSKQMKDHLFSIKNKKKSYNKNESNILTFDMPYLNAHIHVYALTKQTIEDRS